MARIVVKVPNKHLKRVTDAFASSKPERLTAAQHFEQQVRQFVLSRVRDAEAQAAFDAVMTAPIEDAGDPIVTVETVAD